MATLRPAWRYLSAVLLLLFYGCSTDEIGPQEVSGGSATLPYQPGRVVIINEGNFTRGNASLDLYQPKERKLRSSVYRQANDGLPLGDVAQDLQAYQQELWCVLNNSGSIKILDSGSFALKQEVTGLASPQYLVFWQDYAFATDLYQRTLWKINAKDPSLITAIPLPKPAKGIAQLDKKLYLTAGASLWCFNPAEDSLEQKWEHSSPLKGLSALNDSTLVYFSADSNQVPILYQVQPGKPPEIRHVLTQLKNPRFLSIAAQGESVVFIDQAQLYRLSLRTGALNQLYALNQRSIYGLATDPKNGDIYLADALDFNQSAQILRLDDTGQLIHAFEAGSISNGFYFRK